MGSQVDLNIRVYLPKFAEFAIGYPGRRILFDSDKFPWPRARGG